MLLGALLQLLRNQNRNVLQSVNPHHEIFITVSIKGEKRNATTWVSKHNHSGEMLGIGINRIDFFFSFRVANFGL
jgi:hypothetical protein